MKPSRTLGSLSSRQPGIRVVPHPILRQLAADSVFEFALMLTAKGGISFINNRALRVTGYSRDSLRGRAWSVLLKKPDGKPFGPTILRPGSKSNPRKKNFSLVARDGRLIRCTGKLFYFAGADGAPAEVLVMGSSVKRKANAAADLSTDHQLLQSLVESLPDGFTVIDGKGVVLAVNPSFAALTHRPAENIVGGAPPYAWSGREGNRRIDEAFSEVKKTGLPAHRLVIVEHPDRPPAAFSYWITPLRGSFAGLDLYLSSVRDISEIHPVAETRMTESRIDRLKHQVRRNAQRLKTLQDVNTSVLKGGSLSKIFTRITDGMGRLVDHDLAGIYVFENDKKILKPHTLSKPTAFSRLLGKFPIPFGEGIIGSAAVAGKTVMVNNAQNDPRSMFPPGMKPGTEHIIAAPLRGRGSVYGILVVARNRDPGFHEEDAQIVQSFADAANVAIENTALYMELGINRPTTRRKKNSRRPVPQSPPAPDEGKSYPVPMDSEEIGPAFREDESPPGW